MGFGVEESGFGLGGRATEVPGDIAADAAVGVPVVGEFEDEAEVAGFGEGDGAVERDEVGFVVDAGGGLDGGGILGGGMVVVGVGADDGEAEGGHFVEGLFNAGEAAVGNVGLVVIDVVAVEAEGLAAEGEEGALAADEFAVEDGRESGGGWRHCGAGAGLRRGRDGRQNPLGNGGEREAQQRGGPETHGPMIAG